MHTFSALISTTALSPTALEIFIARVLNAPHCLHASISTFAVLDAAAFFFVPFLATASTFCFFGEVGFFAFVAFALATGAAFTAGSVALFDCDRVTLPMMIAFVSLAVHHNKIKQTTSDTKLLIRKVSKFGRTAKLAAGCSVMLCCQISLSMFASQKRHKFQVSFSGGGKIEPGYYGNVQKTNTQRICVAYATFSLSVELQRAGWILHTMLLRTVVDLQ